MSDFAADDGAFYATAAQHEPLLLRPRDGHDGALPRANAVAARALARLGHLLDRKDFRDLSLAALEAHAALMARAPRAFATSLDVLDMLQGGDVELVAAGTPGDAVLGALLEEAARVYLPDAALAIAVPESTRKDRSLSLLRGKTLVHDAP